MEFPMQVKAEQDAALLSIDEVFVYQIDTKLHQLTGHSHKAMDWDINNPDWLGKLTLTPAGHHRCHLQLENRQGIFGQTIIEEYPSPHVFQKVVDSSRYFTLKIPTASGEDILYGLGFTSRDESLSVTGVLGAYFQEEGEIMEPAKVEIKVKVEETAPAPAPAPVAVLEEAPKSIQLQYHCTVCPSSCLTTEMLKQHIETAHPEEAGSLLFHCDADSSCGKRFLSQLTLESHKKTAHDQSFKRRKVQFVEDEEGEIEEDEVEEEEEEDEKPAETVEKMTVTNIPISLDGKYTELGSPYRDMQTRKFFCHVCPNRSFINPSRKKLIKHWLEDHNIQKPLVCTLCFFIYSTAIFQKLHFQQVHFPCQHCTTVFKYRANLRRHLKKVGQ